MAIKIGGRSYTVAELRKFIVATCIGLVILIASAGEQFGQWFSPTVVNYVAGIGAVCTAIGVFLVKNEKIIDAIGTGAYRRGEVPEKPADPQTNTPDTPPTDPPPLAT